MWSSIDNNKIYFAEISRYGCWINAKIKYSTPSRLHGLIDCDAYCKSFSNGRSFKNPLQSDWGLAENWVKEQLSLIDKYGTDNVEFEIKYE